MSNTKKNFLCALFVVSMLAGALCLVYATPTIIAGAPATVNNTTFTTAVVTAFQYNPALQQYSITHCSLQQTTDIAIKIYAGVNGTNNPTQVGVWYPSYTNATTEYIYSGAMLVTNYTFASITTTNSQQLYIGYGQ